MKLANFDFRIWDKGEETLTYASKDWKLGIGFSNPQQDNWEVESVLHAYYDGEPQCPDDCEMELWSGFCDKNNKRIYENDIILDSQRHKYVVSICDESKNWVLLELDLKPCCSLIEILQEGYVEVIGNIHENTELLIEKGVIDKQWLQECLKSVETDSDR